MSFRRKFFGVVAIAGFAFLAWAPAASAWCGGWGCAGGCYAPCVAPIYQPTYRVEQGPIFNVVVVPYEPPALQFGYVGGYPYAGGCGCPYWRYSGCGCGGYPVAYSSYPAVYPPYPAAYEYDEPDAYPTVRYHRHSHRSVHRSMMHPDMDGRMGGY